MARVKDFLLETIDGDLKFRNGDLSIGESDDQHIYDIIYSNPGDWKEFLLVGCSVELYVNSNKSYTLAQTIKQQLSDDGYNVGRISIVYDTPTSTLNITPNATRR